MEKVEIVNEAVETMDEEVMHCVDCGKELAPISVEHKQWYTDHGLAVPKRCPDCLSKKQRLVYEDNPKPVGSDAIRSAFAKAHCDLSALPADRPKSSTRVYGKATSILAKAIADGGTLYINAEGRVGESKDSTKNGICFLADGKVRETMLGANVSEPNHTYTCIDCGETFTMSASDEKWYTDRGWEIPKRCKSCREKKAELKASAVTNSGESKTDTPEPTNPHACIECNKVFFMTDAHEKWFMDKGLRIPTRCPECIHKHHLEKEAQMADIV